MADPATADRVEAPDARGRYGPAWWMYVVGLPLPVGYVAMAVVGGNPVMLLPAVGWLGVFWLMLHRPWTVIDADGFATRRRGRLRRITWSAVAGIPEPTIWTGDLHVLLGDGTDVRLNGVPREQWAGLVALWQVGRFR